MSYSPILSAHIFAGTLGLLSGTAAMSFRKGSTRHVLAGKIFEATHSYDLAWGIITTAGIFGAAAIYAVKNTVESG